MSNVFVLDFPWEMRSLASSMKVTYDSKHKCWTYQGASLPAALKDYASQDFSWERWIEDNINGRMRPVVTLPPMKPRAHQMEAAKKIASYCKQGFRGFIEADDVGTGKTLSTLVGAYGAAKVKGFTPQKKAKLLIVCPKSVIPHWRNTLAASGVSSMFRVVVINYEQSKKLLEAPAAAKNAKRTRTKNKHVATGGTPVVDWDIIIADESHKLKNIFISQRAKAFDRIAQYSTAAAKAPFVIWASASPGQNPVEMGYLAPLVAQITGNNKSGIKDWGDFLVKNGYHVTPGKVGVTWVKVTDSMDPAVKLEVTKQRKEDLAKMRSLLFGPKAPSIRRLPSNIAGWPEVVRIPVPVSLSLQNKVLYQAAWMQFRQEMSLFSRGKNPKGGLAIQLRFRQKASLLKVDDTVETIEDLVDNGLQVAVSVQFIESLDAIREKLEKSGIICVEFSGRNVAEREGERLRFQKGKAQVILFTVTEGISLHAGEQLRDGTLASQTGRATVVHDIRYSGLENLQLSGRCHRDGKSANVYYMFFQNTVEEEILNVMLQRMADSRNISGDDEALVVEIEDMLTNRALQPLAA